MRRFGMTASGRPDAAHLLVWFVLITTAAHASPAPAPPQLIDEAVRLIPGAEAKRVTLPDTVPRPDASDGKIFEATYIVRAALGAAREPMAVYLPGVLTPARVKVNGHVVSDNVTGNVPRGRRGADRLVLASFPAEFVRPGVNEIEITVASLRWTSLSKVWIGSEHELRRMYDRKILLMVEGPIVASAVIMALSLCVLVLWVRQNREPLYGYFGFGGLLWALHTVWTLLPDPLLRPPHLSIWWTMGFAFFCAPLIVFCVRLSKWRLPRFEKVLWIGLALGPALLYAGYFAGFGGTAEMYWRLAWIGAVGVGVFAVGRYAFAERNTRAILLLGVGGMAFAFGVRDWLLARGDTDNNPVYLTSYSGLLFFPLVAWILIDNFVVTARALSQLNVELERRVVDKSAELRRALDDMRQARDAAEAADRAKSSFLAVASHDLRQPAHALGLYVAALRTEQLTAEQYELTQRMSASVTALDTMFNTLLDISRMEAGAVVPEVCPLDLESMLHRVAGDFSSEAAGKGLRFSMRVSKAARSLRARSDPMLLERIVRNLLGNAVRYTHDGGVLLACRLRDGQWRIEVRHGPGNPRRPARADLRGVLPGRRPRAGPGRRARSRLVDRATALLSARPSADAAVGRGTRLLLRANGAGDHRSGTPATARRPGRIAARTRRRRHRRRPGGARLDGRPARTLGLQGAGRRDRRGADRACGRIAARAVAGARRRSSAARRAQRHRRDRDRDARARRPLPDADRLGRGGAGAPRAASRQRSRMADQARRCRAPAKLAHPGRPRRLSRRRGQGACVDFSRRTQ